MTDLNKAVDLEGRYQDFKKQAALYNSDLANVSRETFLTMFNLIVDSQRSGV